MQYLPVNKEQVPVSLFVLVEEEQYEFVFNYNSSFDFFTVTLKKDEVDIITGEKLLLGKPLFTLNRQPFKNTYFIPMDISETLNRITYDTFGENILIYVFREVDGEIVSE